MWSTVSAIAATVDGAPNKKQRHPTYGKTNRSTHADKAKGPPRSTASDVRGDTPRGASTIYYSSIWQQQRNVDPSSRHYARANRYLIA